MLGMNGCRSANALQAERPPQQLMSEHVAELRQADLVVDADPRVSHCIRVGTAANRAWRTSTK